MTPLPKDALALHKDGDDVGALALCDTLLKTSPNHDGAMRLQGIIYIAQAKYDEAIHCFKHAINIAPNVAGAYSNLATAYDKTEQFFAAREALETALSLDDSNAAQHFNYAIILSKTVKEDEDPYQVTLIIAEHLRRAITLRPNYFAAIFLLANLAQDHGWYDEANACYTKARALAPDDMRVWYNHSLQMLREGDFENGWQGYEHRWDHEKDFLDHDRPALVESVAQWDGSPLDGKRILLYAEQGFGDAIQFSRYIPMVKELGGHVIVMYREPTIYSVLHHIQGVDEWQEEGAPNIVFDTHAPLMSLPFIFNSTKNTIPNDVPYLYAQQDKIDAWHEHFTKDMPSIGVVWAGSKLHENDHNRSIALEQFSHLFDAHPTLHFYSIQKGRDEDVIEGLSSRKKNLTCLGHNIYDFSDTAAIIHHLDLVISVDTSVVHLAGAMGKPTFTLLPFVPDWRWMLEREDSPWYPSMRLFRQPKMNDWSSVMDQINTELLQQFPV